MQSLHSRASKTSKRLSKWLNNRPLVLISLGLFIFFVGASHYYAVRILSFDKVPPAAIQKTADVDVPVEIIIPSVNIDLKVDPGQIKDGVWQISQTSATFLDTSAAPGSGGNTVIYGHNLKTIFANLPYISIGQKIIVKTRMGKIYNYVADQKFFVGPDRVDLVSPTTTEKLTIYTCYGLFDSERAVVRASPEGI